VPSSKLAFFFKSVALLGCMNTLGLYWRLIDYGLVRQIDFLKVVSYPNPIEHLGHMSTPDPNMCNLYSCFRLLNTFHD
jgi:hypothetical protein